MSTDDLQSVFSDIIHTKKWLRGLPETPCGGGSTMKSTAQLRAGLAELLSSGALPSGPTILDAPCGDFNWFREVSGFARYIGMDIVPEMVDENARRYASDTVSFLCGDLTRDPLPAADVLLCRDCLMHLTNEMAFDALRNFVRSGIPHLLLTCHSNTSNEQIEAVGAFRPLNFRLPPFDFPEPLLRLPDHHGRNERYVCLWTSAQVAEALARIVPGSASQDISDK